MILPWSSQIQVNDTITGTQTNPHTATLENGNFVVTWEDTTTDTIHYKIYDPTGADLTGELTVNNSFAEPSGTEPNVLAFGTGFVIAHVSENSVTGIKSTTLTFYNEAGVETSEQSVAAGTALTYDNPELVAVDNGFAIIGMDNSAAGMNIQVYNNTGAITGTYNYTTNVTTSGVHPSVIQLGNGDLAIAWEQSGSTGIKIIDPDTGVASFEGTVDGDIYGVPKILAGPSNTFVVAFNDFGGSFPGISTDAKAYLFASDGTVITDKYFLSQTFAEDQNGVEIVALDSGTGYLALFFDEVTDTFMARAFDWLGNPMSNQMSFAADNAGSYGNGSLLEQISATVLDDGRIAVSYQTGGSDLDTSGVVLTILDPREGNVYGDISNEVLYGGVGDDIIFGGGGDDEVYGGGGNDFIYDRLEGSSDNALFFGGNGDDMMMGGDANDILNGEKGNDTLYGGDDVDDLYGGNDSDYIYGGAGDDSILRGNNGTDTIDGGAGRDIMGGGPSADEFQFSDVTHSDAGGLRDRIGDFQQGLDIVNVSLIDANSNTDIDDEFTFIGTAAFSNTAGEIRYLQTAIKTIVQMDVDGDGVVDSSFEMTGLFTVTEDDFIL